MDIFRFLRGPNIQLSVGEICIDDYAEHPPHQSQLNLILDFKRLPSIEVLKGTTSSHV